MSLEDVSSSLIVLIATLSASADQEIRRSHYTYQMSSSSAPVYADNVVNQVAGATSIASLSNTLKNGISRDAREALLVSFLSNGQDPLIALDVRFHTLGILYIL